MELEGSLLFSQEAIIWPYLEPDESSPCPPIFFNNHSIIFSYLGLPNSLFPAGVFLGVQ
jgi:hypothetical protein